MKFSQFWVCLLFLLTATAAAAQTFTTEKTTSSRALKHYEKAYALSRASQLPEALESVKKSLAADSTFIDAGLLQAAIFFDLGRYSDAVIAYEKALALNAVYEPNAWYQLAMTTLKLENYSAAAGHFERYLKLETKPSPTRNRAEKYRMNALFAAEAIKHPVPYQPTPLPGDVNTPNNESLPVFTADGSMLVYTFMSGGREDLYASRLLDSIWQAGESIEAVNTPQNEGAQALSADGKLLIFTACNRMGDMGSCDLHFSEWRNGTWTAPANMGKPINTGAWESQPSLSADGKTLYFASERAGGKGGRDLWVSKRQSSGRWSEPVNLGDSLNTKDNEASPFIHPDGQTLYFMSEGHPGMGGYDLFFSRKTADGTWSKPKNLGYPINTSANEGALVVSLDGQTAYFSGDKTDGKGGVDLYRFPLYAAAQPLPVTYAKAMVFDEQTKKPLPGAQVVVTDLQQ
ncbi:MAG: PD40 domain-containing protein, partial [Saprospiraceae bacterium]|nr:PD40 domain-containing protein [Saprospiraceae bacterium]